jgi:branched-chain amino acid transport system substrate-binding protein
MSITVSRRTLLAAAGATVAAPGILWASTRPIRIGVLTDMSGPFSGNTGIGSYTAAQLAIEDFRKDHPDIAVEVTRADFQLKPDVALSIARQWFSDGTADLITDVPLSSAALAIAALAKERDKVAVYTSAASSDLTGKDCGSNHAHWVFDTYNIAKVVTQAVTNAGGRRWFFLTDDSSGFILMQRQMEGFLRASGAAIVGSVLVPFPSTDYSSYLLQAQASGATVIAMGNSGTSTVNCIKQANDFGITRSGAQLAATQTRVTDVNAMGLSLAKGLLLAEPYYWDMNDNTRDIGQRYAERNRGRMPNAAQAGNYSAVMHYLKAVAAVGPERALQSGRAVLERMKATPIEDKVFGRGVLRADGRTEIDVHLFKVKSPEQSRRDWDYFEYLNTVPGSEAFRPMSEGGCPLV